MVLLGWLRLLALLVKYPPFFRVLAVGGFMNAFIACSNWNSKKATLVAVCQWARTAGPAKSDVTTPIDKDTPVCNQIPAREYRGTLGTS
jgi:hypothetical protein